MPWLIGRKPIAPDTVGEIIEHSSRVPDFDLSTLSPLIPINHGGSESDYSLFQISYDDSNRIIFEGVSYSVTWVDGEITSLVLS